jgi:hypothetical protein
MSEQALTASRARVHLGLPSAIHPIAFLGGDKPVLFVGDEIVVVAVLALLAAFLLGTRARDRVLVAAALFGSWFVAPALFVAALATLVTLLASRILKKLLKGASLAFGRFALGSVAALAVLIALVSTASRAPRSEYRDVTDETRASTAPTVQVNLPADGKLENKVDATKAAGDSTGGLGNFEKNDLGGKGGWLLPGVTPVALPLPTAERWTDTTRELVTKERPFLPRLVYVTTTGLLPFFALWLLSLGALAYLHRARIVAAYASARRWLATEQAPEPGPAPAE